MALLNYSACIVSNWHTVFFRNSKVRLRLCDGVQAEPECRQGDASDNGQAKSINCRTFFLSDKKVWNQKKVK
jgi:hypothetical protein